MRAVKSISFALVLALAACGPKVASIEVAQKSIDMHKAGEAVTLTATPKDAEGKKLEGVVLAFTSSDPAAATVDPTGKVAAVATGDAKVTVASGDVKVEVPVKVSIPKTLAFAPAEAKLEGVGAKVAIAAKVQDGKGRDVKIPVQWNSANPAVATVTNTGEVTAVAAGEAEISAAAGDAKAAMKVVVTVPVVASIETEKSVDVKVGAAHKVKAIAKDAEGKEIGSAAFTFASADAKIATVDAAGNITGVAKGKTKVTLTSGEKSATVEVKVAPEKKKK